MTNSTVQKPITPVHGTSGKMYLFYVYKWGSKFKSFGAVYVVFSQQDTGRFSIIYVGQTPDMSSAFIAHDKNPCFGLHLKTHVGIFPENSEVKRLTIKADILAEHNPVCND